MITTIIPYFLLASVPETTWEHGPEYVFSLDIKVRTTGAADLDLYPALNMTNELKCRPKELDVLTCEFKHLQLDFFSRNLTSKEIFPIVDSQMSHKGHEGHREGHGGSQGDNDMKGEDKLYSAIPFEVKFDKSGVKSLVMSEEASKDMRSNIIRSVANLLNTGVDLSSRNIMKVDPIISDLVSTEEIINFLIGKCSVLMTLGYNTDDKVQDSNVTNFELELDGSLKKMIGNFYIDKYSSSRECSTPINFFWSGLVVKDIENSPNKKMTSLHDTWVISKDNYSGRKYRLVMETTKDDHKITATEILRLRLMDIRPATKEISEIKNPQTVSIENTKR